MSTTSTQIAFIQYHQPALESGEYRVTVAQTLDDTVFSNKIGTQNYGVAQTFYVAGERFHILPEHIKSAFPPPHSLGEHSNVLPHLMLSRNTLPWERQAIPNNTTTPWLALLVIHESEQANVTEDTVTLETLKNGSSVSPFFPAITNLEPGQTDAMKIAVLDIKKSFLDQILPDQNALEFLTHIRQGKDGDTIDANIVGEDLAVLVANRLPQSGELNTVYLVSLEDRYTAGGVFNYTVDTNTAGDDDMIRLVKLYSWDFTCSDPHGDFANILKNLDRTTETLRLPDVNDTTADSYLQSGFYPMPHKLRGGAQTVSWYHGPLSPQSNTESITFPAEGSDALLRYYEATGMFDVSYASAWELGRLLALQNTNFSTELYRWKRRYAKARAKQAQITNYSTGHLQGGNRDHATEDLPSSVTDWLSELKLLKGIPFNYLVPDEELLPAESIRFFQVDALWVKAVLDGAFSIGRVTRSDHSLDTAIAATETALTPTSVSGFILRSEVVSGWPGIQIEGYSTTPDPVDFSLDPEAKMTLLRQEYLSKNVLLCLFKKNDDYTGDEDLQTLDLHLKPEVLHFGVTLKADGINYEKVLRDDMGVEQSDYTVDVPLSTERVLNVTTLLNNIRTHQASIQWPANIADESSAALALQLIEGVEKVRFIKAALL